jgi:ribose/xylose/arabinose/galactoside ABC-type transport system permease subunit
MDRKMRLRCILVLRLTVALFVSQSALANYTCTGSVDQVNVSPNGVVVLVSASMGLTSVYLCQIGTTTNGVDTDPCKSILAVLLTAHAIGGQIDLSFSDSLTCTTHPAWAWLTGWYYGPNLH